MIALEDLPKARSVDLRVDLRRADVGVAKEFLHDSQVRAADDQMRREAVAEDMRVHLPQPGPGGGPADDLPDRDSIKRPTAE